MIRRHLILLAGASAGLVASRAEAHHGWGSYDAAAPVDATGRIDSIAFDNPHAVMMLATADKEWEVILAPPSRMRSRGATEDVVAQGSEVQVFGYPHRSRAIEMRAEWVRVNGTTYQLR